MCAGTNHTDRETMLRRRPLLPLPAMWLMLALGVPAVTVAEAHVSGILSLVRR